MTVNTTTNKINAPGDGIQTNFPYNFKVTDADQMLVYLDNVLYGAAYTVNGVGNEAGGSVDIAVPPGIGVIVTLYRYVPEVQETDYEPYRAFPSETVEDDLDLAVMRDQQLQEVDSRAVKAPINDDGSFDYTLPAVAAGRGIKANATGDGWVETDYDPDQAQNDSAANVVLTNADVVLTNADVVLTHADVVLCDAAVVDADAAAAAAAASAASIALKFLVLDIGSWDMLATSQVFIAHGLDGTKIRFVTAQIYDDTQTSLSDFLIWKQGQTGNQSIASDATNISMTRPAAHTFYTTFYNDPAINRGYITIGYVD